MAFKFIAFNIDGTPETENLDGQNFYKNRLIEAGERFNRQTVWSQRIAFWNLDLQGDANTHGKFWVKTGGESNSKNKYRKLANFASEQMLNYYYKFVDNANEHQSLEYELNTEKFEIFQNMVRFTIADHFNAHFEDNNVSIEVIQGNLNQRKLSDNTPFELSLTGGSYFFHYVHENKVSFFVDVDYPQYYFVKNGNKWNRRSLVAEGRNIETTEVLYWITDDGEINTGLITVPFRRAKGSGGGGGAMRADSVDEVDYRWVGNKAYGLALGLNIENYSDFDPQINSGYINATPHVSGENALMSPIRYYKKFNTDNLITEKKNLPKPPLEPIPSNDLSFWSSAQLQRSKFFYSTDFFKVRQKGDRDNSGKGWMGLQLHHKNSRDRDDAGPVMGAALAQFPSFMENYEKWKEDKDNVPAATTSVSATNFTDFLLSENQFITKWNEFRNETFRNNNINNPDPTQGIYKDWNKRRTDQEWCHLYGHGDGGPEEWGNFVAGSKHCNTTQLAIESGQRKGQINGLKVKVSAYLFERFLFKTQTTLSDVRKHLQQTLTESDTNLAVQELEIELEVNTDSELDVDKFSETLLDKTSIEKLDEHQKSELLKRFCLPLPLAKMIHYKVYYRNNNAFDYFFDAQSESFDYNEFKILQNLVIRAIAITRTLTRGGTNDANAIKEYQAFMMGKLLAQVKKGLISEEDYNNLSKSYLINFGIHLEDLELLGEIDSSDDENDEDRFDEHGFDEFGFDEFGFDEDGFDEDGFNIDGFNGDGFERVDYDTPLSGSKRSAGTFISTKNQASAKQTRILDEEERILAEERRIDYNFEPTPP